MTGGPSAERVRRLLRFLYREEVRAAAYRAYRRRARHVPLKGMLATFGEVEERLLLRIEGHLAALGVGRPGRRGPLRRAMAMVGSLLAGVTALGGDAAILRRVRCEESRGADRYAREVDWAGWTAAERDTLDGHRCDQHYQSQWAQDVQRDLAAARARAGLGSGVDR
jgi:hypothetical protein